MYPVLSAAVRVFVLAALFFAASADAQTVRRYAGFPATSAGSHIVFDTLGSGRIVAWDGSTIYVQAAVAAQNFNALPIGLAGDPAFLRVAPDGDTIVYGAGGTTGDAYAGQISSMSFGTSTGTMVLATVANHSVAEFLTDTQLLVAHRATGASTDELVLFDTTGDTITTTPVLTGIPGTVNTIAVDYDGAEAYVGIQEGELRTFSRNSLLSAEEGTPLAWSTGSLLSGGIGGAATALTDNDLLVLGGNALVSVVHKNTLELITEIDPAGMDAGSYIPGFSPARGEILTLHQLGSAYSLYAFDTPANCLVNTIRITTPVDGATIYGNLDAGEVHIPLTIESDCLDDIAKIDYSLIFANPTPDFLGTASTPPFRLDSGLNFVSGGNDAAASFTAEGTAVSDPNFEFSDRVRITVAGTGSAHDGNGDGIPDRPYDTLDHPGDRWVSGQNFTDARYFMTSGVAVLYGYDPFTDITDPDWEPEDDEHGFNDIRMIVTSDEHSSQSVEVTASEFLLRDDEIGILIVQVAPDLPSLLGVAGAEFIGSVPRGDLDDDGIYVHVAFLVSDDEGASFTEVRSSRLNDNPIRVVIRGQPLQANVEYALRRHPTSIINGTNGVQIVGENGSWRGLSNQTVNNASGRFEVSLTTLPIVMAPFEGTASSGGGGGATGFEGLFAVLYAGLVVLGLAGGEGGDPCFIATAAYGTPMSADINVLRSIRDGYLLDSAAGTAFVDLYYRISPPLADSIAASPVLAALTRVLLTPIIFVSRLILAFGSILLPVAFGPAAMACATGWRLRVNKRKFV